jgi:hypothetical protein
MPATNYSNSMSNGGSLNRSTVDSFKSYNGLFSNRIYTKSYKWLIKYFLIFLNNFLKINLQKSMNFANSQSLITSPFSEKKERDF